MSKMSAFYVFLAALAAKLPQGLLEASQVIVAVGPGLTLTGTSAAWLAPYLTIALSVANAILLGAKQLPAKSPMADAIDAAVNAALAAKAAKSSQRGHAQVSGVFGLVVFGCLAMACLRLLSGCTPAQVQTAELTVPADANLGLCIANVAEADVGKPVAQVILDEVDQCTTDIVPIVNVLDTQVVSQVATGTVSVDTANAKLVEIHAAAKVAPPKPLPVPAKADAGKPVSAGGASQDWLVGSSDGWSLAVPQ